jgi:hypothetical protein
VETTQAIIKALMIKASKMAFYTDKDDQFFLDSALAFFEKEGVSKLSRPEAEELNIQDIFNSYAVEKNWLATPKTSMINIPIPYEALDHDEKSIGAHTISELITNHINSNFLSEKYIVSGRPDIFIGLKFNKFSYDIISEIAPGHLTTPIILLDSRMDRVFFFEYDLGINSYSRSKSLHSEYLGGIDDAKWTSFFNENFLTGISHNDHHIDLIKKYYTPIFAGVAI